MDYSRPSYYAPARNYSALGPDRFNRRPPPRDTYRTDTQRIRPPQVPSYAPPATTMGSDGLRPDHTVPPHHRPPPPSNPVPPMGPPPQNEDSPTADPGENETSNLHLLCYRTGSQGLVKRKVVVVSSSQFPSPEAYHAFVEKNDDVVTTDVELFKEMAKQYKSMCSFWRRYLHLKTLRQIRLLSVCHPTQLTHE